MIDEITVSVPEFISESIKVPGEGATISIRNRYGDGYSGNVIRHSTSIKVKFRKTEYSITIPTCSYYALSHPNRAITELNQFKRSVVDKKTANFVESFIYDNQAAIIAYWYISDLTDDIKFIFSDYFIAHIDANNYAKGGIKPKIDKYLNADFDEVVSYVRKELKDPSFNITFEKPDNSDSHGVATIHRKNKK